MNYYIKIKNIYGDVTYIKSKLDPISYIHTQHNNIMLIENKNVSPSLGTHYVLKSNDYYNVYKVVSCPSFIEQKPHVFVLDENIKSYTLRKICSYKPIDILKIN